MSTIPYQNADLAARSVLRGERSGRAAASRAPMVQRNPDGHTSGPPQKVTGQPTKAARLFRYLYPHRWLIALGFSGLVFGTVLRLAFPYMAGYQVDGTLAEFADVERPHVPAWFYDIHTVALVLLGLVVAILVFTYLEMVCFAKAGERALAEVRIDTCRQLMHAPMEFFSQRRTGELSSRLLSDLAQLQEAWINDLPTIIKYAVLLTGGITLMFLTAAQLSLIVLVAVPIAVAIGIFLGKRIRRISKVAQDELANSSTAVTESLQAIHTVKSFVQETHEVNRYRDAIGAYVHPAITGAKYRALMLCTVVAIALCMVVFVMWRGSVLISEGTLTPGEFTRFMFYLAFVGTAGGTVGEVAVRMQKAFGATERIRDLQEQPSEEIDRAATESIAHHVALQPLWGEVEFRHVEFAYPSRPELSVLHGVSFHIEASQRVALVGPSGAGKSTIISLVQRFFEPTSGQVLIDGRPAWQFPISWLRGQMALVPQDTILFGGTVAENIAYGMPQATEQQIEEAAQRANAHGFVSSFPEGYQTIVGERGLRLSGGQRQRIAIARAILKNPSILILDEATSSLDSEAERLIQEAMDELMKDRTTIIIAHRLSTVRRVDNILVVDHGRVVDQGRHDDLVKRDGLYANLCQHQFGLPETDSSRT